MILYFNDLLGIFQYSYQIWNGIGAVASRSLEFLALESAFPSEFEFGEGASLGFRPISPGSGIEFSVALGGNRIREQFTGTCFIHLFKNLSTSVFQECYSRLQLFIDIFQYLC